MAHRGVGISARRHLGLGFRQIAQAVLVSSLILLLLPGMAHASPPANDGFTDATAVTEPLPFTDSADTSEATTEAGEPQLGDVLCGSQVGSTVWYSFTPSADTVVSANTFGSDFDTVLGVWEGTDIGSLALVGCIDDSGGLLQSSVVFLAEMGTEYRIQVGGYSGASGNLEFRVREVSAGIVEGTLTDADSSAPLGGICVSSFDAAFGVTDRTIQLSAEDGSYRLAARPGEYLVHFYDCQGDNYIPEWWDDASSQGDATEIVVTEDSVTTGVDAALTAGCPGFASRGNQILGTPGSDTLKGTDGTDVICGFGGDDKLVGRDGRDIVIGGAGDDTVRGGAGSDRLLGGSGRDSLFGGDGNDLLLGNDGRDRCSGGRGEDRARSCEVRRGI